MLLTISNSFFHSCISYCLGKRNLNSIFIGMTPDDMDIERENDHNLIL